jgi:hypothetical protein
MIALLRVDNQFPDIYAYKYQSNLTGEIELTANNLKEAQAKAIQLHKAILPILYPELF